MADFVAVLRHAIDGLNDNKLAIRQRIYERARLTVATRLELVGPPPVAVVERHKRVLEDAIAEVERAYGEEPTEPVAEPLSISDYSHKAPPAPQSNTPRNKTHKVRRVWRARERMSEDHGACLTEMADMVAAVTG